jgi:hypothetical protein
MLPRIHLSKWEPSSSANEDFLLRTTAGRFAQLSIFSDGSISHQTRWFPRWASQWDIANDVTKRPASKGECRIFYSFPIRTPGFMAINYLTGGEQTSYRTLLLGGQVLEEIARSRKSIAIVCQAVSVRLSDRLMHRWGFVRHALTLGGNHYIRRLS